MHHMYHPYVWVEGLLPTTNGRTPAGRLALADWPAGTGMAGPRKTSGPAHIRERLLAYANGSEPATAHKRTHGTSQFRRRCTTVYRTADCGLDGQFRRVGLDGEMEFRRQFSVL